MVAILKNINYQNEVVFLKEKNKFLKFNDDKTIFYNIYENVNTNYVGYADLRLKKDEDSYYYGDIGYHIYEEYRGHHYAYYACLLLFEIAKKEYHLNDLIITCNPDNIASYKTLLKLNGEYIETIDIPKEHELYKRGEKQKCIFRYKL